VKNRCLAIGDLAFNISLFVEEFLPVEFDQEVFKRVEGISGAPSYFSVVACQLGMKAGIISRVGTDSTGKRIINALQQRRVDVSQVIMRKGKTPLFVSIYDKAFQRKLYFHASNLRLSPNDVNRRKIEPTDIVYICPTTLETSLKAAKFGRIQKKIVAFGPGSNFITLGLEGISGVLANVDFLFLNEHEARLYCRKDSLVECCRKIAGYGTDIIAITRGAKGCFIFENSNIITDAGFKVRAENPTGAGEAFVAGFLHEYLETKDAKEAAKFANATGACAVSRKRVVENPPTLRMIRSLLKKPQN